MRRPAWTRRRSLLIIALGAPLIGLVGVTAAEIVPDGRIAAHLVNARQRGEIGSENHTVSLLGTRSDHFAECVAVLIGVGDPPGNLVKRALYGATAYGCVGSMAELDHFAATGELPTQPDYMRYWHGYAVFTRPSLAVLGLSGTRWLAFALLGLSIAAFARSVFTRFGAAVTTVVLVPGLLTTDMIVGGWSIAHALGLATAWIGGWIVLSQASADGSWQTTALAAALGGAVSAYVDLMIAIPASLALCTAAAGLAAATRSRRFDGSAIGSMGVAVCGWAVGLAAMWAAKWVFAWLLVDRQRIVDSVRDTISFRTSGEHIDVSGSRWNGFLDNFEYWLDEPLAPPVIAGTIAALGLLVWLRRGRLRWGPAFAVAGVAVVIVPVIAWYVILNNHNQVHFWLTYRSVAIAFGGAAAVGMVAVVFADGDHPIVRYARGNGDDEAITSEPPEEQDATPESIMVGERPQ